MEYITKFIAGVQQRYTQSGGVRPFGISTLIIGFDPSEKVPRLYMTEPSGIYSAWYVPDPLSKRVCVWLEFGVVDGWVGWLFGVLTWCRKANAIGRSSKTVREFLERNYKDNMSRDETIKLTIKSLLEVVQTGAKNIEIAILEEGKPLEVSLPSHPSPLALRLSFRVLWLFGLLLIVVAGFGGSGGCCEGD